MDFAHRSGIISTVGLLSLVLLFSRICCKSCNTFSEADERMYDWAEFRHFRYLLAILEKQGFRAAAESLHTAQPNLSAHARQFQDNASVRLYRKTKSGRIRVTETGVVFIALARFLLETHQEVIETLIAFERGELQSVRFGCSSIADPALFRDFCASHKRLLPSCQIRPSHGDTGQLAREVSEGLLDAAVVTLPLEQPDLKIEPLRSDPLVCCLRKDDPLASKTSLRPADLQANLSILLHPERHPDAHERLLELFADVGIKIQEYSRATHPSEVQSLVKDGYGFALVSEGMPLDDQLTTRPIAGVNWTVDMAAIYHRQRYPKTIPLLIKRLRKDLNPDGKHPSIRYDANPSSADPRAKRPSQSLSNLPKQLNLLSENDGNHRQSA
jgi:DNA-binding transcriptional LysR family regulator